MSAPYESDGGASEAGHAAGKGEDVDDAEALFLRGTRHYTGEGVPQDHTKAARLWRLAAERGHAGAQAAFGACYMTGQGVLLDDEEAARWFRLAAEKGHAKAQFALGDYS